ncbi:MAG: acetate--CoA ligase family protein, partial [Gammaproteobacteria bacterium]|nr:acetate--CoA ligase family protein [Gammaproteobacteria bacterium]
MTSAFIPEFEIYELLSRVGIKTPRHFLVTDDRKIADAPFASGDPVVIKGMARDLWHKSEHGALAFCDFDTDFARETHGSMSTRVGEQFDWIGTLIVEQVEVRRAGNAPSEIFVSLKRDSRSGDIISLGFGGLLTEDWARELKQSLLVWPVSAYTPEEAFAELEGHWLGKILLGKTRQTAALVDAENLLGFLRKLWKLDELMARERLGLVEINPLVVDSNGAIVALDGVGLRSEETPVEPCPVPLQDDSFLNPRRIAVAGVSAKAGSVGSLILENLRQSALAGDGLLVVKPGVEEFSGIRCVPDVAALANDPVDVLILALPAERCVQMIEQLCAEG